MNRSKQAGMAIKSMVFLGVGLVLASVHFTEAQQQAKVAKIGWLGPGTDQSNNRFEQFRREFHKLGYVDGKNVSFESRYFGNEFDQLPALAEELVGLKVDVIVTRGTPETLALKKATKTIPIVFYSVTDPIGAGLGETSRGSLPSRRCWPANDWSYSRRPYLSSPVSRCCGILRTAALCNNGKKANRRHGNSDCNFIPWK
jgi:ABC-type uncharacterized transport system substrate-binding protein